MRNHLPTDPTIAQPDLVLGQTSWAGVSANAGQGSTNQNGFNGASGVCYTGAALYISDYNNNRILGWNSWPTTLGQNADFVLGQSSFAGNSANAGGISRHSLFNPANLDCTGGRLVANDRGNNRVLIWNVAPTSAATDADAILGQSNGTSNGAFGAGGIGAGGISGPYGVALVTNGGSTAVLVSDFSSNRVTQWSNIPTSSASDGLAFDRVYGQPNATATTANNGGRSLSSLNGPYIISAEVSSGATPHFWVADSNNARELRYQLNTTAAVGEFGQRTGSGSETAAGSVSPANIYTGQIFQLDPSSGLFTNSFFLGRFWSSAPTNNSLAPNFSQGEPDLYSSTVPVSVAGTNLTQFATYDAYSLVKVKNRLYWNDSGRVLSTSATMGAVSLVPDVVLGNQNFTGTVVAPSTYDYKISPSQLATDGNILYVTDGPRIVGYDSATSLTTSNQTIDFALGQPDKVSRTANNLGISANSLSGTIRHLTIANGKLFVADSANNRVLIWNTIPTLTGTPADVVVGQSNFNTSNTGTDFSHLNNPGGVTVLNGKLIISDSGNSRILVWKTIPTVSGTPANSQWQPQDFFFSLPSWVNLSGLAPGRVEQYQGRLYLSSGNRVLVLPDIF
jgi:hypothetical protein